MKLNNINAATLTREISLTNGLISQWKKGKQKPSTEAIIKLAKFFNVSTDYLLLGKNSYSEISLMSKESLPDSLESKVLIVFKELEPDYQAIAYGELLKLKKEQEKELSQKSKEQNAKAN